MKLNEILEALSSSEHLQKLQREISDGKCPEIADAAFVAGKFSFGDLEQLKWAVKKEVDSRADEIAEVWVYLGPKCIKVNGKVMEEGDETNPVWVDRS